MIDLSTLVISPEMVNLISAIDTFKGGWQYMHILTPERLSALKKVATIESIGSSTRIEGAKLSDSAIAELLGRLDTQSLENRDEQEVVGYAHACEQIVTYWEVIPLTENNIKQIHSWLLQYSAKDDRHRGKYKTLPITIEAFDVRGQSVGVIFETTSPLQIPWQMQELVAWTRAMLAERTLHPLLTIGIFIVIFLAIHPFQDGNGRLSRLLTTLLMLQCGYQYVPYSSLESIIEANKESYYQALHQTQKNWQENPQWSPWLLFFLSCLQRQKSHLEAKIAREERLIPKLSPLAEEILVLLHGHGPLQIQQIELLTEAKRPTLKKTLAKLVAMGRLQLVGKGKASYYRHSSGDLH